MRLLLSALAIFGIVVASTATSPPWTPDAAIASSANPPQISAFAFFGNGRDNGPDKPRSLLIPYTLKTPLFSDYAEKQRFIYLPTGAKITVDEAGHYAFPVGTALVKSFGYPDATGKLKIIETRLLLHRADGWVALPYVWRADGSDADLRVGGTRVPAHFMTPSGRAMDISYSVPNKNQCKECHGKAGQVVPIGPRVGNLVIDGDANKARFATALAVKPAAITWPKWDDPKSGSLDERARAYLDVNCSHCHNPQGSASNSGLFLGREITNATAMGIGKRPVAAGRGAGDHDFVIDPGYPEKSIMIYRMKSTEPGIAMPELGRSTVHEEGVTLLEEWIVSLPKQ